MTDHADYPFPDPIVQTSGAQEIARDLLVVPNQDVNLVPNIGLIGGSHSVLVVDTGLGPRNAQQVLALAREFANGRRLYLTTTHFHPEHAFGAQTFAGEATYLVNRAQADDLAQKGAGYLAMFTQLGKPVARELAGTELPTPDVVFDEGYGQGSDAGPDGSHDGGFDLDLGGRTVRLRPTGRAHSRGDQVVTVPDAAVLFTGDLAEAGQFAIFPWFPPHDTDVSGLRWIKVMRQLAAEEHRVVVPGHGAIGDASLLAEVRDYLTELRDETWRRRDTAVSEETVVEEVRALMVERHPDWRMREWIERGVGCLCAEHAAGDGAAAGDSGVVG